jgi:hypothetical protein
MTRKTYQPAAKGVSQPTPLSLLGTHVTTPLNSIVRFRPVRQRSAMETVERHEKHDVKKARILTSEDLQRLLDHIDVTSNSVESDRVKLLLSYYAGLRAAEFVT